MLAGVGVGNTTGWASGTGTLPGLLTYFVALSAAQLADHRVDNLQFLATQVATLTSMRIKASDSDMWSEPQGSG